MTSTPDPSATPSWSVSRLLEYSYTYSDAFSYFSNLTDDSSDFDSQLVKAEDVSVSTVLSSLIFNAIAFLFLMGFYECLRRALPTVYSSRKKLDRVHLADGGGGEAGLGTTGSADDGVASLSHATPAFDESRVDDSIDDPTTSYKAFTSAGAKSRDQQQQTSCYNARSALLRQSGLLPLPDDRPLDWVGPVFGVPWKKVRSVAGLDGYFFLRYIRMNVRITAVSTFWFFAILVPIYVTGGGDETSGWYYFSAANLSVYGWRMWAPCVFCYLFTAFITFVIKQEYRHFLEIRQDFLARGAAHVNPQHHYSLMIENVPYELRSDRALKEYFEKLFPGKVHSASVVLKLPDLEEMSARCLRTCRRLEKSIAYLHATGERPTHISGRGRLSVLGVDLAPVDCSCMAPSGSSLHDDAVYIEDGRYVERPSRGTRVDSISYYTQELAAESRALFKMQKRKTQIAESGNLSFQADNWLNQAVRDLTSVADAVLQDSIEANDLVNTSHEEDDDEFFGAYTSPRTLLAGEISSQYGSFPSLAKETLMKTDDRHERNRGVVLVRGVLPDE